MKQTAVETLIEIYYGNEGQLTIKDLDQAKAMEKEQIMDAFEAAEKDCGRDFLHGDLYYNETYEQSKQG